MLHSSSQSKTVIWGVAALFLAYLIRGVLHQNVNQNHGEYAKNSVCDKKEGKHNRPLWFKQKNHACKKDLKKAVMIDDAQTKNKKASNDHAKQQNTQTQPTWFTFLKENEYITSDINLETFDEDAVVTREMIVPYLLRFSEIADLKKHENSTCIFNDIEKIGLFTKKDIVSICEYGLLRGTKGNFKPGATMNQSEMLAILARSKVGYLNERKQVNRFKNYYNYAVGQGYVKPGLDKKIFDQELTKKDLALWLQHMSKAHGAQQILAR